MEPTSPKLSLVAQFDDFCRQLRNDTEHEELLLDFVQNQEECRKRWHAAELEIAELKKQLAAATGATAEAERKLAHIKDVLEKEVLRREKCEQQLLSKQHQLELIREFLLNDTERREKTLTFLKQVDDGQLDAKKRHIFEKSVGSVLSPSDASDEDECRRSSRGKRRSSGNHLRKRTSSPQSKKKRKSKGGGQENGDKSCASVVATTTVTVTDGKDVVATSRVYTQPLPAADSSATLTPASTLVETPASTPMETSMETPVETPARTPKFASESAPNTPLFQRRVCSPSPSDFFPLTPSRRANSVGKLMSKPHCFVAKTMMKTETCGICGKRIGFYKTAVKCAACRCLCHPECRDRVPLPCVPVSQTPTQGRAARRGTIADYAPSTSPMVPALVVHCIQEVERRGLTEVGLYRVPGGLREVQDVRTQFQRGRGVPNLSQVDIHVVCSVLKDFLLSLSETLITKSLWHMFVKATELQSGDRTSSLWQAVNDLPPANRDTLAALVLHLQTVANSPEVKMPIESLVTVFAPTVVGYSTNDTAGVSNLLAETHMQSKVMRALLDLPGDYWSEFLSKDSDDENIAMPEPNPGPRSKLFGPIYSAGGAGSSSSVKKTSRAVPKRTASGSKKPTFFSPMLR